MALMHYVATQTIPGTTELLPIQQRSLGPFTGCSPTSPLGIWSGALRRCPKVTRRWRPMVFSRLANRQIWGNIAIGLGNRLSVFQNPLVDKITSYNEIDLTLPGKSPAPTSAVSPRRTPLWSF